MTLLWNYNREGDFRQSWTETLTLNETLVCEPINYVLLIRCLFCFTSPMNSRCSATVASTNVNLERISFPILLTSSYRCSIWLSIKSKLSQRRCLNRCLFRSILINSFDIVWSVVDKFTHKWLLIRWPVCYKVCWLKSARMLTLVCSSGHSGRWKM